MEQITKEQAIAIYKSKDWETWSDEAIVKFQLFQKKLAVPFSRFHQAMESVLNRPVYTHEFAESEMLIKEYLGAARPPTLDEALSLIPDSKLMIYKITKLL